MKSILNITNGDSAVNIMQEAGIPGVFLPWRDVLHEGPVPAGLSLDELSELRAQYIIEQGWGEPEAIRTSFIERDNVLKAFEKHEKILLWFEHDLYDQLQIVQILDWFSQRPFINTELTMICTDQYLGMMAPGEMKALARHEKPISGDQLQLSNKAWTAFRSTTPERWRELLETDTSALPFLEGAIIRLLEEYPSCSNGLSRTAQQALTIIRHGEQRPGKLFGLYQKTEERKFMGDTSFWGILQELLTSNPPLLKLPDNMKLTLPAVPGLTLAITPMGRKVLDGEKDWLDVMELDRWIGGVHLRSNNVWRWDGRSRLLETRTN